MVELLTILLLLHVVNRHDGLVLVVLVGDGLLLSLLAPIATVATIATIALAAVSAATLTIALAIAPSVAGAFATPMPLALPLRSLVLVVGPTAGEAPLRWALPFRSLACFSFRPVALLPIAIVATIVPLCCLQPLILRSQLLDLSQWLLLLHCIDAPLLLRCSQRCHCNLHGLHAFHDCCDCRGLSLVLHCIHLA